MGITEARQKALKILKGDSKSRTKEYATLKTQYINSNYPSDVKKDTIRILDNQTSAI